MIKDFIEKGIRLDDAEMDYMVAWNLADEVTRIRQTEKRKYDQISMKAGSMYQQMKISADYVADKTVAFLGEGIMAVMFGAFHKAGLIEKCPKHMIVLDFDEGLLAAIDNYANEKGFGLKIETHLYNVGCPVPDDLLGQADYFYTNPPYGSKNKGQSLIIFIDRCIDLTHGIGSSGCIILPYEYYDQPWTREAMLNVQSFLTSKGCAITDMVQQLHIYHLEDNPLLESATMFVTCSENKPTKYRGKRIPMEEMKLLYGSPRKPPFRIRVDESEDFDWTC